MVNTSDYKTAIVSMEKWAKEKGVELEVIEENTQTYASSYVLAAQTQNPRYDVIMFWDFYMDQLYPMLTPLDGSYDPKYDLSTIDDGDILRTGYSDYKGHPYNIPYGLDAYVLYYRTDLLAEAGITKVPETWDELVDAATKLTKDTDGDGNIDQWGMATNGLPGQVFNTYSFFNFLLTNGGSVVDAEGKPLFNSPEGVEALQLMVDMRNKHKVMPPDVITYDNNEIHEGFLSGKFAMITHWPYVYGMTYGSEIEGKVGYAAVPHSAKGKTATVLNAWSFGIPTMSENKDLAWDLATYLLSTEAGAYEFSQKSDWPFRQSAYEAAAKEYEIPQDFLDFSTFVFDTANTNSQKIVMARGGETSIILGDYIDQAMNGRMSARDALDAAFKDINELLES
ncbi:MAG: sugar ABC transporter substrate-binding protein [Propionicimonas sp.]